MPPKNVELKLAQLTREFFARNPGVKLVAVTGSAGKTSTKIAIATVLSKQYNIQLREEAPETRADVFLQIMGVKMPEDDSRAKWKKVIEAVEQRVMSPRPEVQVIVQEFSPQKPGDNEWFRDYLMPDITVVTAVTDGRMQVEHSLEEVAHEMITLANNSKTAMINRDDIEGRFAGFLTNPYITTYGIDSIAEYHFENHGFMIGEGMKGVIVSPENPAGRAVTLNLMGDNNVRPAVAAAAVAYKMGVDEDVIISAISNLRSVPGRMSVLKGGNGSWLIDDSYSSSPTTALAALQALYSIETPQRIAVLGSMNGLRGVHEKAHEQLGGYCNIEMLDWVVTVGGRANLFLAPAARKNGCQVKECIDAIEAGAFVREKLQPGGIALFKGSSGGVWLEEAVKLNLLSATDSSRLVRQTPEWQEHKQAFFTANRTGDAETINELGIDESDDNPDYLEGDDEEESKEVPIKYSEVGGSFQISPKTRKKIIKYAILAGIGLVIAIVVSSVYSWWQNPDSAVSRAFGGALSSKQMTVASKLAVTVPENHSDIGLVLNSDGSNISASAVIKLRSDNLSRDIEFSVNLVHAKDGELYVRANDVDTALEVYVNDKVEDEITLLRERSSNDLSQYPDNIIEQTEAEIRSKFDALIEQISDQWLKLKPELLGGILSSSCSWWPLTQPDSREQIFAQVARAYSSNQFIVVKNKIKSKGGSVGYELDLTHPRLTNRLKSFADTLRQSEQSGELVKCSEDFVSNINSVRVWITPWTHQLTAIEIEQNNPGKGSKVVFSGDFKVGSSPAIGIPADSENVDNVVDQLKEAW